MKKYKQYIITIIIIMMLPILYKAFLKERETSYKVDGYDIKESFLVKNKTHQYTFFMKKGKEEYSYILKADLHKKGKIITNIKTIKKNDLTCIMPTYRENQAKQIYCRKGNIQVSNEILKENEDFQKIMKKEKIKESKESETKQDYKNLVVYSNNIPHDQAIILWDYKGIIILERNKNSYQKFLDYDLYDNLMATTTKRYYVMFENTSVNGIEKVHCYDLKKGKYKVITLKDKIEKNSYINGVVGDIIYITDQKKKKQYTLNVKKEELLEVGNPENGYIIIKDNQKETMKITDFFPQKQFFTGNPVKNKKISESENIQLEENIYYFQENNSFYQQIKGMNRVEQFNLENVVEWKIKEKEWILLQDDTLYLYQENLGLRKIVEYNELKYNYQNIYDLWK